ncbi:MAG: hypothetical protein NC099_03180 [Corallococcus sp.]|nr:hypothetical protein [Corallococcus sp.]
MTTIAIALLAWQLLTSGNSPSEKKRSPLEDLSQFVSDDAKSIIDCVGKLSSNDVSQEDKTGAIFQMMTNPAVINIADSLFKKDKTSRQTEVKNDEGYTFEQPSLASQEFFRPIDNIADAEIKHKLYRFYDNWYVNK